MMIFFFCFRFKCVMKFSLFPRIPQVLYVFLDGMTVRIFGDDSNRRLQSAFPVTPIWYRPPTYTQTTRNSSSLLLFSKYNFIYIFHSNIEANIYIPFRATSACKLWLPPPIVIWHFCSDRRVFE